MVPSIKLFVILGTQKFPFNRLMKALDELIEKGIYKQKKFTYNQPTMITSPKRLNIAIYYPLMNLFIL